MLGGPPVEGAYDFLGIPHASRETESAVLFCQLLGNEPRGWSLDVEHQFPSTERMSSGPKSRGEAFSIPPQIRSEPSPEPVAQCYRDWPAGPRPQLHSATAGSWETAPARCRASPCRRSPSVTRPASNLVTSKKSTGRHPTNRPAARR